MCPAETVDVILLGTMDLKTGNGLGAWFPPATQNMPSRGFVGIGCALPAFQPVNLHRVRHFSGWMPSEIVTLASLMRNNEDSVFAKTRIRWKFVEQELRKKGVEKSLMAIKGFLFPPEGSSIRYTVLVVATRPSMLYVQRVVLRGTIW